jgi:hypothetical protein
MVTPENTMSVAGQLQERKERVDLPRRTPPTGHQKHENPKWSDDPWFEKWYGDPDYYHRIRGLN